MNRFILIIFCASIMSLTFKSANNPFYWLEGVWEMKKANGSSRLEVWSNSDEASMTGKGLKVMKADTALLEAIELAYRDEHYWYIPTVPNQNKALPVPFELVNTQGFKYTFENEEHDFPQRIIYHLKPLKKSDDYVPVTGDTLYVRVESFKGNGFDYQFYRK
ncbi:MAG TPA: DUF6265 family protein [Saprospiraceae bacterium]|nr:DUF6265 family protein [Saprospiraceae bacterium]